MKMTARFRELVQAPEILMLPVAHDGLSALVLAEAGFSAMSVAGYGTAGSMLGMPDIGVLSSTEMLTQYAHIVDRVDIPVMVDIDRRGGTTCFRRQGRRPGFRRPELEPVYKELGTGG